MSTNTISRGTLRADGLVFWGYSSKGTGRKERWVTPEVLAAWRAVSTRAHARVRETTEGRERHRQRCAAWARNNPEARRRAHKTWRLRNPGKAEEFTRRWYRKNLDRVNAVSKKWKQLNRPSVRAAHKRWYLKNTHVAIATAAARRAAKRSSGNSSGANSRFIAEIYRTARRISGCLGVPFHVDHVRPLSRGGEHHERNLQVIPAKENLRKYNHVVTDTLG